MSTGAVFFAHKKRITERNSHLAGEASRSSISNGCQAKTERRRQLAGAGTGRTGTKLHASAPGSRVTAFLATAAPWETYFTDNLRTLLVTTGNCGTLATSTLHTLAFSVFTSRIPATDFNTVVILVSL
jgi:hypothetical protein